MATQRITFQTTDDVTIIGDFGVPSGAARAVLLLHMMPATRISFAPLVTELFKAGVVAILAIDLRGHGESITQGSKKLDYKNFSDVEHQASRLDVDAAMNFLKEKGFDEAHISFVGASIGANLVLDAMYRYKGTLRGILLSPSLDYRGVATETPMKGLSATQKVWLVAAEGDSYSADSVKTLAKINSSASTLTVFQGGEHGTNLFQLQPTLVQDIVKFLM